MEEIKVIRCSSCGSSDVERIGNGIGKCNHCGSTLLFPKQNQEIISLLNSAQVYRENFNYDLAIKTYQLAIEKDSSEITAYEWLLLSEYGIEYVKDVYTGKMIPTCHRAHFSSILDDPNYKILLTLANDEQRKIIEAKAKDINKLQDSIKKQLENEESYDIFISCKATDKHGHKTEDSLIARNIYEELTNKKYKVFFAEKSLENKLGTQYEPIIFKAIHTCKIFILVGTSKENVESNWVRNEWSRFLDRLKSTTDGSLSPASFIPVFKDMSPYDMPKVNNAYVQSVDASKIGYVATISDGVQRLLKPQKEKAVLDILEEADNIEHFEKVRKQKLAEAKKQNWKDLQTNPKRKVEKIFYNLFIWLPHLLGLVTLLLAMHPVSWFTQNAAFYALIILMVITLALSIAALCVHIKKKYPLNKLFSIIIPFSLPAIAAIVLACCMCFYPLLYNSAPYTDYYSAKSYGYQYENGFAFIIRDGENYANIYSISKYGLKKHIKDENGEKVLIIPRTLGGKRVGYVSMDIPDYIHTVYLPKGSSSSFLDYGVVNNVENIIYY